MEQFVLLCIIEFLTIVIIDNFISFEILLELGTKYHSLKILNLRQSWTTSDWSSWCSREMVSGLLISAMLTVRLQLFLVSLSWRQTSNCPRPAVNLNIPPPWMAMSKSKFPAPR